MGRGEGGLVWILVRVLERRGIRGLGCGGGGEEGDMVEIEGGGWVWGGRMLGWVSLQFEEGQVQRNFNEMAMGFQKYHLQLGARFLAAVTWGFRLFSSPSSPHSLAREPLARVDEAIGALLLHTLHKIYLH